MPLLRTVQLKKYFGETRAVDHVDFVVEPGEFLALVGMNGAGKTTLVNVITGFLFPDEGTVLLDGTDITRMPVHQRIPAGVARSFQIVNLFDDLSTLDNVRMAILSRDGRARRAFSLLESERPAREEAFEVLNAFGLADKWRALAAELGQGERKLLDVAMAYALGPKLVFLDEPTSGVATREKNRIMDIIQEVVRGGGLTPVVVEHDMEVVFTYSDRVVVMHQGKILADGAPEEIRADPEVQQTLLGAV